MKEKNCYLFVYGTLLDTGNEYGNYLLNNSTFYSNGQIKGKLFDIGEYPGAIYLPAGDDYVYGKIYLIDKPDNTLKILDEYECFGENVSQPNLFRRELIEVETDKSPLNCWVYLYNLPLDGLSQITSGSYFD
jgi:gamma-glutamylcyclotransferase (GGCT)/AIG2-like uncharacterized protein YtfP